MYAIRGCRTDGSALIRSGSKSERPWMRSRTVWLRKRNNVSSFHMGRLRRDSRQEGCQVGVKKQGRSSLYFGTHFGHLPSAKGVFTPIALLAVVQPKRRCNALACILPTAGQVVSFCDFCSGWPYSQNLKKPPPPTPPIVPPFLV